MTAAISGENRDKPQRDFILEFHPANEHLPRRTRQALKPSRDTILDNRNILYARAHIGNCNMQL